MRSTAGSDEIGIRMALGARHAHVLTLVLCRSVAITGVGLILGLAAAATATRHLEALLFGVAPLDPMTFAVVAVVLAGVTTTAALIPALRATRIDPLVALRSE